MTNTKKLLYFAYGTNLNKKIFLKKYKNAKYLSKHILAKVFNLSQDVWRTICLANDDQT